jgi:hypothetical protein
MPALPSERLAALQFAPIALPSFIKSILLLLGLELFRYNVSQKLTMEEEWRKNVADLDNERRNLLQQVQDDLLFGISENVRAMTPDTAFLKV